MKKFILYIMLIGFFSFAPNAMAHGMEDLPYAVELSDQTQPEKVVLSPNPANTVTHIRVNSTSQLRVTEVAVYSVLGSQLLQKSFDAMSDQNIQLNVSSFKKGKYLVKIMFSDGTTEVKTLIKQ
ncbi:MAG: T9SS type A sorting domain-containing protein [Weeksellaceae bacterium]|nr:T9SS type A sorting domain-containing protein [Weeksellaceae bacterium]